MPAYLFHQNMRVFGGGAPARNAAYGPAFLAINGPLGGPIVVAGFTEIVNHGAAVGALGLLSGSLNCGLFTVAACGETVLARGPEYIGIAVNLGAAAAVPPIPAVAVLSVGRILINADRAPLRLISDIAPMPIPPNWETTLPQGATYDYRGVVYAVVNTGLGATVAVGFLHNLYTFKSQRALVMEQIPAMFRLVSQDPALPAGSAIYLGGDFNVSPPRNRGTARTGIAYAYSAIPGVYAFPPATPGGTTWNGSLYDYWYANLNPAMVTPIVAGGVAHPVAAAASLTMDNNLMSDHCATGLRII